MEEADAEHAEMVAICVGQGLADQGRPAAWDTLEVADLLACVPGPHSEQVRFARTLIDILSWMATARLLEPDGCELPRPDRGIRATRCSRPARPSRTLAGERGVFTRKP